VPRKTVSRRTFLAATASAAAMASCAAGPARVASVPPTDCMPGPLDYTFLWWAFGVPSSCCPTRGRAPGTADERKLLCVRTGRYGFALDVEKVRLAHFGPLRRRQPAAEALVQGNEAVFALPRADLRLRIHVGQQTYQCVGSAAPKPRDLLNYPCRIIESGRFVQRFDVLGLVFEDAAGRRLGVQARLEVVAWPDMAAFVLEATPGRDLADARLEVALGRESSASGPAGRWKAGETRSVAHRVSLTRDGGAGGLFSVTVLDGATVSADTGRGWFRIALPQRPWRNRRGTYYPEEELDRLERTRLMLHNPSDSEQVARLLFAKDYGFPGITGFCPMLRDGDGCPTGIPVQLSKNWHCTEGRRVLYDGGWFHGFSFLRLPPRSTTELELAITYARWGGVFAASHAQLCLIGWGHNQRWDEAAIGSFGESICYDPDATMRRCRIDDLRPLLVWATNTRRGKWSWTNNVGGGDFLVYFDGKGEYQYFKEMKAAYDAHGPNLTEATYAGTTVDGRIAARITVSTPRCDDINRAFHRFRYDVLEPTRFRRLAFYQLGADRYLGFQFRKIARGNAQGLIEEWQPGGGGRRYLRTAIPCEGEVPWFSLHETLPRRGGGGAWANRGLIVRSWSARLGGRAAPAPFAAVYGTQSGVASAALELSPPPGVEELLPGDFVEAEVELVVVPMSAADYYGPNEALRAALREGGNTWRPVFREAAGNHLQLKAIRGTIRRGYPIVVEVGRGERAELEVTGGVGYVPITFAGLRASRGYQLRQVVGDKSRVVDQSVHGNDFWQTDYDPAAGRWRITYNVCLDGPGRTARFVFEKGQR